jgi:hypothetical protein
MKTVNRAIEWGHGKISHNFPQWSADVPLLRWNVRRPFTIGHSLEHVLEFGATGSGKTSACLKSMALAMMHAGYGVLFLSAKATDPADYYEWAKLAGREKSVVHFGPKHRLGFNLLEYELARKGEFAEHTMNVSTIFASVGEILARNNKPGGDGASWELAAEQLLRHALNVVLLASGKADLDNVMRVILSTPKTGNDVKSREWLRDSFCHQQLDAAEKRHGGRRALMLARQFLMEQWAIFPEDTKNSAFFTFSRMADLFQNDPLHRMFFSKTDFTPEILLDGAVLIVDEPALAGGDLGSVINGLMRLAVQRMIKQRKCSGNERPVAIIWDEFQTSVTHEDSKFAAVARSHRCGLVMATQNVRTVNAVMGSEDKAMTLFGNCRTKLFFANDDPATNLYMAEVVGKWPVKKESRTTDHQGHSSKQVNPPQDEYAVPPRTALVLKSGGKDFGKKVTGIMTHTGYELTKGQPWMKVKFNQGAPIWHWWNLLTRNTGAIGWRRPAPDFRWLR